MSAHKKVGTINWSADLAYVVGLITTDGNLSKDGRHFDFTSNDIDLIVTLKKILGLNNRISKKRSGFTHKLSANHIQFGNVILYRWLCSIGLLPNKSKKLGPLKLPDEFFFDFIRGHIDGDRSIKKYYDPVYPKSLRLYISLMSASLPHLIWIKEKLNKMLQLKGFFRYHRGAYTLTYCKKDSIKLLTSIYHRKNLPALKRKYIIAEQFLTI